MMTVEIPVVLNGSTMSFSTCEQSASRPTSGFALNTRSNFSRNGGVPISELEGKSREYHLKIASFPKVPRAEEARSKRPVCEGDFGERLGNRRFSGSSKPVEPKHASVLLVREPPFDLEEHVLPCPLQASPLGSGSVVRRNGVVYAVQQNAVYIPLYANYCTDSDGKREWDSRWIDSSCRRCLAAGKSDTAVRHSGSEASGLGANLIVHQGITNLFHQAVKFLCILGVVKESRNALLGCS